MSSPTIEVISGGAIYNDGAGGESSPLIANAIFFNNKAVFGGAIRNVGGGIDGSGPSTPVITNSIFYNNTAFDKGGAIYNTGANGEASNPVITNSIIYGNGDEIFNRIATPIITYSLVDGGYPGTGNIDANPQFVNSGDVAGPDGVFATTDDGLQLQPNSPAIDTGNNSAVPDGLTTDLTGTARIQYENVDMGAYEKPDPALTIYVDASATGAGNGSSWNDAFPDLQDAISFATENDQIWIAEGTYYPGTDRNDSFRINGNKNGLKIYGGFAGNESTRSGRDPGAHPVVLSGEIGTSGNHSDNSYHVLFFDGRNFDNITRATVLDGVTVTAGYARENATDFPHNAGGGLFCNGRRRAATHAAPPSPTLSSPTIKVI
ncbi:MAG: choice-of-anchor Q domain-containing protein [Balneolaceae bacterium]|nr:choice-of-anchor Q domain-containing protein [Balneolaceae bacterium]